MTTTSYSLAIGSTFQRRERHKGGRGALPGRIGRRRGRRLRIEARNPRPKLGMLVAQLPIGFGEPLETPRQPARPDERRTGGQKGRDGCQPVKGQQTSYLSERLATVSTA